MRAVRNRSSANLIHHQTSIKIDVFIAGGTPLDAQQIARRLERAMRDAAPQGTIEDKQ